MKMAKNRMEAFSDGVLAIIITIMVLEMKPPHGTELGDLIVLLPRFLSYVLSFIYIGIYWNNHHHLLNTLDKVSGTILWSNLHLLFWLSLIPFATAWMGESHFAKITTALYGFVLLMSAISYSMLQQMIICSQGENSFLKKIIGADRKGKLSIFIYFAAIIFTGLSEIMSISLYALVALIWLVPDLRIEKASQQN